MNITETKEAIEKVINQALVDVIKIRQGADMFSNHKGYIEDLENGMLDELSDLSHYLEKFAEEAGENETEVETPNYTKEYTG